jgi:hypothetical protein
MAGTGWIYIRLGKSAEESFHCIDPKVLDPPCILFPAQLLTLEHVENTLQVVNATSNNGAGCVFLCLSLREFVSLVKFSYISQKASCKNQSTNNGIECMINKLKESNEVSFIHFSDDSVEESLDGTGTVTSKDAIESMIANTDTITISAYKVSPSNFYFGKFLIRICQSEMPKK